MHMVKCDKNGGSWRRCGVEGCVAAAGSYPIDLLAILRKSLDRALFLYVFIHNVRSSDVKASITIVHIR